MPDGGQQAKREDVDAIRFNFDLAGGGALPETLADFESRSGPLRKSSSSRHCCQIR